MTLHYGDGSGQYVKPIHLAARASVMIDVGMLLMEHEPDVNGNLIPEYIQEGTVTFSNPKGNTAWMTLAVCGAFYNPRKGTCGDICEDCYGYGNFVVDDDPWSVPVGNNTQMHAYGTYSDGSQDDFTTSSTWSSNNTSVATVGSSSGLASGVSPGSAILFADYPELAADPGEICYYPADPVPCPTVTPQVSSGGSVISVQITNVSLTSDEVDVSLGGPSGTSGTLLVQWTGSGPVQAIANSTYGPGTQKFNPPLSGLVVGGYTGVSAQWTVNGTVAQGSFSIAFYNFGTYSQTQYNTPLESQCAGGSGPAYLTTGPPQCPWSSVSLIQQFILQAWNNGSGDADYPVNYGPMQEYLAGCSAPQGGSSNYFRQVSQLSAGCGGSNNFLDDHSVAAPIQTQPFRCGDSVLIVGLGGGNGTVKTVTDECPACEISGSQLDNYSTSAACSLTGLGNYQSIRINR